MAFPPPPVDHIDWNDVGFKVREVNGHIESHYSLKTKQWSPPTFNPDPFLRMHGMAPALNYGQQAYEGIKCFRLPGDQKIAIFRPGENARRMIHSAAYISVPPVPEEHFLKCVHLAVSMNAAYVPPHSSGAGMYIRPILFGSSAQLGLQAPEEYMLCVYVMPTGVYHGNHPVDCLILETFDRAAPEGTGSAKIGGNYAPVLRHSDAARAEGFGITLHLDSQTKTYVDEFSTSGFIGVKRHSSGAGSEDKYTLVVPDSKSVINSVTSSSACSIAQSLGWTVEKRPIPYTELSSFCEVLAAGTAAGLVPIKSITMKSKGDKFVIGKGDDEPGPVYMKLLAILKGTQTGKMEDRFGWLSVVEEPKAYGYQESATSTSTNGMNGTHMNGSVDKLP